MENNLDDYNARPRASRHDPVSGDEAILRLSHRLRIVSLVILVAGLLAAVSVYFATAPNPAAEAGYENVVVDGKTYMVPTQWSKEYMRGLERFGGGAAVMFDRFDRWFAGLWQGRRLAVTLAWLSVFIAGAVLLVARRMAAVIAAERAARTRRGKSIMQ